MPSLPPPQQKAFTTNPSKYTLAYWTKITHATFTPRCYSGFLNTFCRMLLQRKQPNQFNLVCNSQYYTTPFKFDHHTWKYKHFNSLRCRSNDLNMQLLPTVPNHILKPTGMAVSNDPCFSVHQLRQSHIVCCSKYQRSIAWNNFLYDNTNIAYQGPWNLKFQIFAHFLLILRHWRTHNIRYKTML